MENLPATKMRKKANFTDKETHVLLEEIGVEYTLLVSDLQNTVTVKKKREVWQNIAEKVNAVGCHNRDWEACKKRWKDLKAAYLRKPKYDSGTGGGKAAPPVPYEDMIKQIMGAGTNLTHGIKGGGDTYMAATEDQQLIVVNDPDISGGGVPERQLSSTLAEDSYVSVHDFTLPVSETQDTQIINIVFDDDAAVSQTAPVPGSTPSVPSSASSSRSPKPQNSAYGPKRKTPKSRLQRGTHTPVQDNH